VKAALLLAAALALSGCVAPQFVETPIEFRSTPPGAAVNAQTNQRGVRQLCTTPCIADVRDDFGFISTYTFTARKAGYRDAVIVVRERHIFDARPPVYVVEFNLERLP